MRLDRRQALSLLALGAAAPLACSPADAPFEGTVTFGHGVASGDPQADRVVLWTRVTPGTPAQPEHIPVAWEIASDESFATLVRSGRTETSPARDYTVKVDAGGLTPGTRYHYRFRCGEAVSPVGRTATLPETADRLVIAVASCALHPGGYFNAYDALARLSDLDAVIHLGDYIYEYGAGENDYGMRIGRALGRVPEPATETVTLADYRRRHAQYRADPDLQAAHARAPWICAWDDHELTNDPWVDGAENHGPDDVEGTWVERKAQALRAYFEWMPIREPAPGVGPEAIYRAFRFGRLATLLMLETRLVARTKQLFYTDPETLGQAVYAQSAEGTLSPVRDPAVAGEVLAAIAATGAAPTGYVVGPDVEAFEQKRQAPERALLGPDQSAWLSRELARSVDAGTVWQILGSQMVMARVKGPDFKAIPGMAERREAFLSALPESTRLTVERVAQLFAFGLPFNTDAWDGYPAERERVLEAVRGAKARPIVVSGDSHAYWVNNVHDAAGGRVAAEFGTTAVTSPSWGDLFAGTDFDLGAVLAAQNQDVVFCDQSAKGVVVLTLTPEAATADLLAMSSVREKPYASRVLKRFRVAAGAEPGALGPLEDITGG